MEHLRVLLAYFKEAHPEQKWPRHSDALFTHIEETLLPHLLRVIQKDNKVLSEVELFPGINVGPFWSGTDEGWKKLHMALLYSVLNGDTKQKFSKIMETVKGMVPGGNAQADEITKILEDEGMQSSLMEMLDLVMNTRLATVLGDVVQSIQFADLDINLEDPEQLLEIMRNPNGSPVIKELMERAQMVLEERIKSGKINQQELARDIETIRAKFQSSFGKYLNEMIVGAPGNTTGNTGQQILSNHPDARRARMLARLQKKHQQKTRS